MSTIVNNYSGSGKDWEVAAVGPYRAVIGAVYDVGIHDTGQHGHKQKVCLAFELDGRDSNGRRFIVFKSFNKSAFPTAALRPVIDAALGDNLTDQQQKSLDLRDMNGKTVRVEVAHTTGGNAKIVDVRPATTDMPAMETEADFTQPFGIAKWMIGRALGTIKPEHEVQTGASQRGQAAVTQQADSNLETPEDEDIPF